MTFAEIGDYLIVGNFHGVQFLWMVGLDHFAGLIFIDVHILVQFILCSWAYFANLIFTVKWSFMKLDPSKISSFMVFSIILVMWC